jgi:fructose-1,6-bisphosphatase/inositol monophosphatase family enzyme
MVIGSSNVELEHLKLEHMSIAPTTPFFDALVNRLSGPGLAEVLALRTTATPKSDGSYVTEGDLLVQRIVLELIETHLPDALLVSEEMENTTVQVPPGRWVVVLDPIDGTENFTSGLAEWGISVCCYIDGRHAGSLIGAPEMGQWLRSGQTLTRFRSRIRGLSSSLGKEDILKVGVGPEYRMLGCCVVNMMNVIRGSFLTFENPKGARSWDIIAGFNLALEHGLSVEVDGQPYTGAYLPPDGKYRFKVG